MERIRQALKGLQLTLHKDQPSGGKPSTDALLSAESARLPLTLALLQVTGDVLLRWHTASNLDACAGERTPHNWSMMLQERPLSVRPDFGPDFGPYFWVLPSDSFFPAEGLQACERFPHIGFQG